MRAEDESTTLKKKGCRLVCRQSVMIERRDPLFADLCRALKKTQKHNSENEQIRTLLERQKRADSR